MHYNATNDLAFCHLCMMGAKSGKLSSTESAFIFSGFSNNKKVLPDVLTSMKEV